MEEIYDELFLKCEKYLEEHPEVKKEFDNKKLDDKNRGYNFNLLRSWAFGDGMKENIVKEYCRTNEPAFDENAACWSSVRKICIVKDCYNRQAMSMQNRKIRGCTNKIYWSYEPDDIYIPFCLEHNICKECRSTSLWGEKICESCD